MIEPTDLSAVPEVGEASVFEEFFLAHHERRSSPLSHASQRDQAWFPVRPRP